MSRLTLRIVAVTCAGVALSAGAVALARPSAHPDLRIGSARAGLDGSTVSGTVNVINRGSKRARTSSTDVLWRRAGTPSWSRRTRIKTRSVPASKNRMVRFQFTVPRSALPGRYAIRVCADSRKQIRERSESNNCRRVGGLDIDGPPAPVPAPSLTPSPVVVAAPYPTPSPAATPAAAPTTTPSPTATSTATPTTTPSPTVTPTATPTTTPAPSHVALCGELESDIELSPEAARVYVITCTVRIASGKSLSVRPGVVLKFSPATYLRVDGTLVADGSAERPVVFTSLRDDSVGGDTNGDAGASTPSTGDWGGLSVTGAGSVELTQTRLRHAGIGLDGHTSGAVRINGGEWDNLSRAVDVFAGAGTSVRDVKVHRASRTAFRVRSSQLDLDAFTGNSADTGAGGFELEGRVTKSSTLHAQPTPWVLDACGSYGSPTDVGGYTGIHIDAGIIATIAPGAVLKNYNRCGLGNAIRVEGSLIAAGTAADPVTFTSLQDDSVGGDTNGDAGASTPSTGDWGGITVDTGGAALLDGTHIRYATVALDVASKAAAEIHGRIADSTIGVRSHSSFVDASDVDWGHSSGPSPIGSGTPIEGDGVFLATWVGMPVSPEVPEEPITDASPEPPRSSCATIELITVRGSGESPQGDAPDFGFNPLSSDPEKNDDLIADDHVGGRSFDMFWGFRRRLEAKTEETVSARALRYRGLGTFYVGFPTSYFGSISDGVQRLVRYMKRRPACDGSKVALAGYSQGALVIHLALRYLARNGRSDLLRRSKLAAVMLLADPAKVPNGDELTWESPTEEAGTGVRKAEGLWRYGKVPGRAFAYTSDSGPLPSQVTSRTIHYCRNHDIVCAPGQLRYVLGSISAGVIGAGALAYSDASVHTSYTAEDLNEVGEKAADLYIDSR